MALSSTQRTEIYIGDLLEDVPNKEAAAEAAGVIAIDLIKEHMLDGISPVKGYGKFEPLSIDYANKMKGGSRLPNLYLEGDLQKSLDWDFTGDTLIIGVDDSQTGKSDGQNNFSGDSKLPMRRFLAGEGEVFKFQKDLEETISLFKSDIEDIITLIQKDLNTSKGFSKTDDFEFAQEFITNKKGKPSVILKGLSLEDLL